MTCGRWRPAAAACLAVYCLHLVGAMEFDMQAQVKCIYEEINANVLVVGDWSVHHRDAPGTPVVIDLRVEDPNRNMLHESHGKVEGQFAFTTKLAGEYTACFTGRDYTVAMQTKIKIDWKTGVAATDWNSIAKKEHLDEIAIELRKLEDNIRAVYTDLLQLQTREQEMRDISEETNSRVAWYSLATLGILLLSSVWQIWYLKKFFQRKKLL